MARTKLFGLQQECASHGRRMQVVAFLPGSADRRTHCKVQSDYKQHSQIKSGRYVKVIFFSVPHWATFIFIIF